MGPGRCLPGASRKPHRQISPTAAAAATRPALSAPASSAPQDAHWIWVQATAQDPTDGTWTDNGDRACCRYTSTHNPINCNAARVKYVSDYVDVHLSGDYAYSQYTQTGRAEGRIWHSELCNEDGSDVDHDFDDATGQVHICADDGYTLYINGKNVGSAEDYTTVQGHTFTEACTAPTIYAIDAYDTGGVASLLFEANHCGELILSSSSWKCEQFGNDDPPDGWTTIDFDDSTWNAAGDAGDNGADPWGFRQDISQEAHWIWTADPNGHDHVYCRYKSTHVPLDCPAAQARYWQDYRDVAAYDGNYESTTGMESFDHYTRYGMNEGRIWHSELCNDDLTNKHSECEVKHTSDAYEYDFLQTPLGTEKAITFSVKAHNDAHIGFFHTQDPGDSASSLGAQYEIVLSGWGGAQTVIRESAQGENHGVVDTTGALDPDDFRQFWASAANGLIRLGAGNIVGFNVITSWQDPDETLAITWAAVATGWGNEGDWVVCIPERCSGYFDAAEAILSGPIVCTSDDVTGVVNGGGCDGHAGYNGNGYVDYQNPTGDRMTFTAAGCSSGLASLVFNYAYGSEAGNMGLIVNGADQGALYFPPTGGWDSGHWHVVHTDVQLTQGVNTITLTTTGTQGPNVDHLEVESARADGKIAKAYGHVFITADNGYTLYINGERIGAGGAGVNPTRPDGSPNHRYNADGWTRTDRWYFSDACNTPTSFAVEAVDSEGTAALLVQIEHCGSDIYSGTQWKCSPVTPYAMGADREFVVVDTPMNWDQANQYCTQHYSGLASIHNAEEQLQAKTACAALVTTDEIVIGSCTASTEYSDQYSCEKAYDNVGARDQGEWATLSEFGGSITMTFADATPISIGSMAFQQRWAEVDWATETSLTFSDGSSQIIALRQVPDIVTYTFTTPVVTNSVTITFTQVKYPRGSIPPEGYEVVPCDPPSADGSTCGGLTGNVGAKEIQFFESGQGPHGCWIGLNQGMQSYGNTQSQGQHGGTGALSWSDGSIANYQNWAPGEPNGSGELVTEMDFRLIGRCTGSAYAANQQNGCETAEFRDGEWNDNGNGGDGGNNPEYPLCQSATFNDEIESTFVGCYIDSADRDMQGLQAAVGGDQEYFEMGDDASAAACAERCAGFVYFGLQYGSQCFCDNANAMSLGAAPDPTECNMPCTGDATTMCGGAYRNSIYRISTQFWENAGFDDSMWANAADLGPNGISPWRKRPRISSKAHWIWSSDPQAHDHIFCRHVQPNSEMNCPAAQAKYLHEHPFVKSSGYPAWQHYNTEGKQLGFIWHEDLCNTCTPAQMESACDYAYPWNAGGPGTTTHAPGTGNAGSGTPGSVVGDFGGAMCQDNLCTDKCVGKHDAASAVLVGAVVDDSHADHYGLGFVDFLNPTGDSITFEIYQCQAGRHLMEITYALQSDTPPRPLRLQVNGGSAGQGGRTQSTVHFPATGSWTEWGTVTKRVDLVAGHNTITLTASSGSGPNIDTIELFPNGDSRIGHFRGNLDNSGTVYVNNQAIGGPANTGWDITSSFTFSEPCDEPTVYAIHAVDAERDESGTVGWGGIVGEFEHCNEVITTNQRWKCVAVDDVGGSPTYGTIWNSVGFDDSSWEPATNHGQVDQDNNHWNTYTLAQTPPYRVPRDAVAPNAHWIWTADVEGHDDVYCRYESHHTFTNCNPAANRYLADYGDSMNPRDSAAWDHFNDYGKFEGKVWHNELCSARCEAMTIPMDWIDAQDGGILADRETFQRHVGTGTATGVDAGVDDSYVEIELPFPFPFYGQLKHRAIVSTNGYLTFSGDHTPYGNTESIPSPHAPNDMIAAYWTDLTLGSSPESSGNIYTKFVDPSQPGYQGTCNYGIAAGAACCKSTCGSCGGTGCENRPGGEENCCTHAITGDGHHHDVGSGADTDDGTDTSGVVMCRNNGGRGPCKIDQSFFVVEWANMEQCCSATAPAANALSNFQVILGEDGSIKLNYKTLASLAGTGSRNPGQYGVVSTYAMPVTGIENAAGNEALVVSDCSDPEDRHAMATAGNMHVTPACARARNFRPNSAVLIKASCGSNIRTFSVGWCANYNNDPTTASSADSCTYQEAELFCQDNYGGQLASIETQDEYDALNQLITGNVDEQYLLGLQSDGNGNWAYTDGTHADMAFLTAHSNDPNQAGGVNGGLLGTVETNMVFYPKTSVGGTGGLHDCCVATEGGWSNVEGFVCEMYAAEGQFAFGTGRTRDEAESFCQAYYGGSLATIRNQADYDKIASLAQGYTNPIMIGLHSDGSGNWAWADPSQPAPDMTFLRAHSFDQLAGTDETNAVFYPPVCQTGFQIGGATDNGDGSDYCDGDTQDAAHFNHALHDWGGGDVPMAFVCSASGKQNRVHMGNANIPGYEDPTDGVDPTAPGGGH